MIYFINRDNNSGKDSDNQKQWLSFEKFIRPNSQKQKPSDRDGNKKTQLPSERKSVECFKIVFFIHYSYFTPCRSILQKID